MEKFLIYQTEFPAYWMFLSNINVDGYICNKLSYRELKRLEKILEDAKFLQPQSLKEKFTTNNRTKRRVPSEL